MYQMYPPCVYSSPFIKNENDIKLYSTIDNTVVQFPEYLNEVSGTVANMVRDNPKIDTIPLNFPVATLEQLSFLVDTLPNAARNIHAERAPMKNIYQVIDDPNPDTVTILVNSLVWEKVFPLLNSLSPPQVYELLKLSNFLDIPSLLQAIPRFIADKIYADVMTEKNVLRVKWDAENRKYTQFELYYDATKKVTEKISDLPDELVIRITKYIYLQTFNSKEKTIADWIGMKGLPKENIKINLSSQSITGLSGIVLILIKNTVKLNLSYNAILGNDFDLDFPESPFEKNLQKLNLSNNLLTSIPENIFSGLGNLKQLNLSGNQLTSIPENTFSGLGNLEELNLFWNQLITLPENIFSGLRNLEELNLSKNQLSTLLENIFSELMNLNELSLSKNQLSTLPEKVFVKLVNLEQLELHENQLIALSEDIFSRLLSLAQLNLNSNRLTTLPENIFSKLVNLQLLKLSTNQLSTVQDAIFRNLSNLRELSLMNNQLTTLKENIFSSLGNLQWLDLSFNQLTTLKEKIFSSLGNLQRLNLSHNQLTTLKEKIFSSLGNLQWLDLSDNQLTTLPENTFSSLRNLQWLNLNHNWLHETVEEFRRTHPMPHNTKIFLFAQNPSTSFVKSLPNYLYTPRGKYCSCVLYKNKPTEMNTLIRSSISSPANISFKIGAKKSR